MYRWRRGMEGVREKIRAQFLSVTEMAKVDVQYRRLCWIHLLLLGYYYRLPLLPLQLLILCYYYHLQLLPLLLLPIGYYLLVLVTTRLLLLILIGYCQLVSYY